MILSSNLFIRVFYLVLHDDVFYPHGNSPGDVALLRK